ncbi:hypothetical protein DV736_g3553, partial [Chaetothyriales sp. CBS 134916]
MAPSQGAADDRARRKIVNINRETVTNTTSTDFPLHHPGEDLSWSLDRFHDGLSINFHQNDYAEAVFSLVGIDAALANAFRRILLAEVPTLAIEKVYVKNNTSVIADEVLSHRLGLIPLKGDLDALDSMTWFVPKNEQENFEGMERTDYNTVVLKLEVACTEKRGVAADAEPAEKYHHRHVYARDLVWEPIGDRQKNWPEPIEAAYPDIMIAKLRAGQKLDMLLHAHIGVGKDHAKFSPVATATYRLLPLITITRPILGTEARKFQQCFPDGVIELERVTPADASSGTPDYVGREGDEKAVVKNAFKDTVSRECLRHDEFKDKVKLGRVQDHFIFSIESTGQFPSDLLFLKSVGVLRAKAKRLLKALDDMDS